MLIAFEIRAADLLGKMLITFEIRAAAYQDENANYL
jgi:hypothetical protein